MLSDRVPSESLLEDVNEAVRVTRTLTETNQLIYTTVTVILEILGYKPQRPLFPMEKEAGDQDQGDLNRS